MEHEQPGGIPSGLLFGRNDVGMGMLYPAAVAVYLPLRAVRVASLGQPTVGIFEDGYAASLVYGGVLGLEHPLTGEGGFSVQGPLPTLPARLGLRPNAGSATLGWLNDRGLMMTRPVYDVSWQSRAINPSNAPSWVRTNWTASMLPTTPEYEQANIAIRDVWRKAKNTGIIPAYEAGIILKLVEAGFMVFPKSTIMALPGMTEEQNQAWMALAGELRALGKLATSDQLVALVAEGERLAANAEFWESMERITRAVATVGLSEVGKSRLGWVVPGVLVLGAVAVWKVLGGKK